MKQTETKKYCKSEGTVPSGKQTKSDILLLETTVNKVEKNLKEIGIPVDISKLATKVSMTVLKNATKSSIDFIKQSHTSDIELVASAASAAVKTASTASFRADSAIDLTESYNMKITTMSRKITYLMLPWWKRLFTKKPT